MNVEVILPQEGMAMQTGIVSSWLKSVGDVVRKDEILAEVEAEKATFDIVSPVNGVLAEIRVDVGTEVPVRTVLAVIATDDVPGS